MSFMGSNMLCPHEMWDFSSTRSNFDHCSLTTQMTNTGSSRIQTSFTMIRYVHSCSHIPAIIISFIMKLWRSVSQILWGYYITLHVYVIKSSENVSQTCIWCWSVADRWRWRQWAVEAARRHVWFSCWRRLRACGWLASRMFWQLRSSWISQVIVKIFHLSKSKCSFM